MSCVTPTTPTMTLLLLGRYNELFTTNSTSVIARSKLQ